jgi:hypothetical protein
MKCQGSSPLQLIFPEIPFIILFSILWCSKFPLCFWVPVGFFLTVFDNFPTRMI